MRSGNVIKLYYAKPGHLFDPGTEVDLIEDYRIDGGVFGLFLGLKNGKWIESMCRFSEFTVKIVPERDTRSVGG